MRANLLLSSVLTLLAATVAAHAGSLTTVVNSPFGTHAGHMFNVTVGSQSLTVTALDINVNQLNQTPATLNIYLKTGTYVGSEQTPGAWTLASFAVLNSANPNNTFTLVDVPDFTLQANTTYGLYVMFAGQTYGYPSDLQQNKLTYSAGSNTYSNADLSLFTGTAIPGSFTDGGYMFPNRTWNGTIYYNVVPNAAPVPEPGSAVLLGTLLVAGTGLLRRRQSAPRA